MLQIRDVKVSAHVKCIATAEEIKEKSVKELDALLEEAFSFDNFAWQRDNKISIDVPFRADGLHRILYKCPHCKAEHEMTSHQNRLWCENCGHEWTLTETGKLQSADGATYFEHVPDWYRWERKCVDEEVKSGAYRFEDTVRVEHLQSSAKGFVPIGTGKLVHDENGFYLSGTMDDGNYLTIHRPVDTMYSCHIEYDFKGKGDAIDLPTYDDTYFVYPLTAKNHLTKIHFAVEALHKKEKGLL
jgi:ribosomal protein S27AE